MGGGDAGLRSFAGPGAPRGRGWPGTGAGSARGAGSGGLRGRRLPGVHTPNPRVCSVIGGSLLQRSHCVAALCDPRRLLVLGHHVLVLEPCRSKPEIKARPCVRRWEERSSSVAERRDWRAAGARARWQPYPRQPSRRPTGRSHRCRSWLTARFAAVRRPTPPEPETISSRPKFQANEDSKR